MLEIKTIIKNQPCAFDKALNTAILEGWELTRRECYITGSDRAMTFYAELERFVDDPEEEENEADAIGEWEITRNPARPFRCSLCGHTEEKPKPVCPECIHVMLMEVD